MSHDQQNDLHTAKYDRVRRQIMSKLPKDMGSSWRHYIWNEHAQGVGFMVGLCCAYYYQQKSYISPPNLPVSVNGRSFNVGQCLPFLFGLIIGWAITGIVILGHDAFHKTFAPNKTALGRIANKVAHAVCMHWFGVSPLEFNDDHEFHHKYVNSQGDNQMISLHYNLGTLGEVLHVGYLVARWWLMDLYYCVNIFSKQRISVLFRLNLALSLLSRALLFGGGYVSFCPVSQSGVGAGNVYTFAYQGTQHAINVAFRPLLALTNCLCTAYAFNYCFFGHHVSPKPTTPEERNDHFLYTLRNTADLFPGNSWYDILQQFLHAGTTRHASHHGMGIVPRSLTHVVAKELKAEYPQEYREVNSVAQAIAWYWEKVTFGFASELQPFE